ncbi:hypothetical protein ASG81_07745 [Paenibacillus sp. Soil522]|nr:hypothetical protein ASG81_07745 [Paenibacillus sp. Soil522]
MVLTSILMALIKYFRIVRLLCKWLHKRTTWRSLNIWLSMERMLPLPEAPHEVYLKKQLDSIYNQIEKYYDGG